MFPDRGQANSPALRCVIRNSPAIIADAHMDHAIGFAQSEIKLTRSGMPQNVGNTLLRTSV